MFKRPLLLASAVLLGLTACSSTDTDSSPTSSTAQKPAFTVAASFYPIEEIARRVVGDTGTVIGLTPSGDEAHGLELTAKQLDQLAKANFLFFIGDGFQPTVEKAAASLKNSVLSLDLLTSVTQIEMPEEKAEEDSDHGHEEHGEKDPHVWLDPANMAKMTRAVEATLAKAMPDMASQFANNADLYVAELNQLGDDIDAGLKNCESRAVVTSHEAFGYLAARANLTTIPIAGVNPEDEPSAKELQTIAAIAKEQKASTVFFEVLLPEDLARTLAKSIGATTSILDPIEGISTADLKAGATYLSIQRDNLARLVEGLRCT
jgi:zinc transport system substrate-binding protein